MPGRESNAATKLLAGLALLGTLSVGAAEPMYFECRHDPSTAAGDQIASAKVMVDRARWQVVWVAPAPDGFLARTRYDVVAMTPQEVVARPEAGDAPLLRLNTVTGQWSLETPLDRSQNRNVWDAADQRLGYTEDVQLYAQVGGTCTVIEPG